MDRLWVRLSLAIGALLLVLGLLVLVLVVAAMMHIIPPIIDGGRVSMRDVWRELPEGFVGLLLVTGTIGTLSGVLVSRILSAPLTRLAAAAHQIGEGDLSTRISLRGSREIKDLASSFNHMAAELEEAETLRNNLMADVSHELRTPLTALEGNLRAALDHVYDLKEEELAHLYGQTRHLIQLVNDLRELALAEAHKLPLDMELTNIGSLAGETVATFIPLAEAENVSLKFNQDENLPLILVDALRIRQVLHNLIDNALCHTPENGRITVAVEQTHDDEPCVCLSVTDTGQGVDPQELESIFDRFYRTDKSRSRETGGTGLGLAITKAIIHEHGGSIHAISQGLGKGTTFEINLCR